MSEGFVGADIEAMARLERVLRSGADEIANVSGQTFSTMRALQLIWRGQVMELSLIHI